MFEIFYGFTATPFTKTVAPEALFLSQQHQELLARLQYLARNRGFGLVIGEVGAGKSTAIRSSFASGLDPSRHQLLYISQSGLSSRHLYRELCLQLGLKPAFHAADTRRQITQTIWDAYKNHDKQPTIVIDEAHLLSSAMLEEVRFLTLSRIRDNS